MDPSALDIVSRSLESALDSWAVWLTVATALVVAGLLVEYWHPVWDFFEQWRRPAAAFPWKMLMELAGGILVTVGVAGELYVTYKASLIETNLRENNRRIEAVLNLEAKQASDRAEQAKRNTEDERLARIKIEERVAWRRLSKAQQAELGASVSNFQGEAAHVLFDVDVESQFFAHDIDAGLRGGGWRIASFPQKVLSFPTTSSIETGVEIVVGSSSRDMAAGIELQKKLGSFGYDARRPIVGPPGFWGIQVTVNPRPEGPQGDAKLRHEAESKKKSQRKKR